MKRASVLFLGLAASVLMLLSLDDSADAQGNQWGTVKGRITWGGRIDRAPAPPNLHVTGRTGRPRARREHAHRSTDPQ